MRRKVFTLAAVASAVLCRLSAFCLVLLLAAGGCGAGWPAAVENGEQLRRYNPNAEWIRGRGLTDADMELLGRFRNLEVLDFVGGWKRTPSRVTAKGMDTVADLALPRLEVLSFRASDQIDDGCLLAVSRIKTLKTVQFFAGNRFSGKGISRLAALDHLATLDVMGCQGLTDADLRGFAALRNVKGSIELGGCRGITDAGVRQLQAELPQCTVGKHEDAWDAISD